VWRGVEGSEGSVKDTLQAYGSGAIHIMRRFRGLCADGPGSLRRYFNLPRQSLSIRRAAAPHPASWGRSLRTRRCAPQGKHEARLVFEIPGVSPLKRKRHSLQTHTLIWSSSLARLAAAAAMATLTAAALVAVTLVAAAAPGQQRELSLQCWRQLAAAAGGGGWRRHCWRQPCGGGAAVAARRRRCSALPQQARPDSTGSLPARPAHSNAPAAPADCWMATVANVGEVVRRRDQLIRRRRSLDHGRRRRLTRVHGRQQACSPPAL